VFEYVATEKCDVVFAIGATISTDLKENKVSKTIQIWGKKQLLTLSQVKDLSIKPFLE
jgi:hypothetical protein